MADRASEIERKWRESAPPEASVEDVERVLEARFPGRWAHKTNGGSHLLMISDSDLLLAERNGFLTGTRGGRITISVVKGRHVKKWLLETLIKAIDVKVQIQTFRSKEGVEE
jgi:hypothetical protein